MASYFLREIIRFAAPGGIRIVLSLNTDLWAHAVFLVWITNCTSSHRDALERVERDRDLLILVGAPAFPGVGVGRCVRRDLAAAPARLRRDDPLDWARLSCHGATGKAPIGGEASGPNPTDTAKGGRNVLTTWLVPTTR